jgi:basic membrane lipoprotein Med (substrate-binding protein (PBP1-ABC) superfamily)
MRRERLTLPAAAATHRPQARHGCAALACGAVLLLVACDKQPTRPATGSSEVVSRIVAQCAEDMARQTCRVMGNAASSTAAADESVVFVAGVGAIDAKVYNRLLADGEAMCETVRKNCIEDWDSPACKTARALYPAP